mmetsp:Transcript_1085/g.2196  ORF Transcript_1085/g.2196 Transcript_1085/m.2196 type:complete len:204 (-) Transcript_1085:599-1210(-)
MAIHRRTAGLDLLLEEYFGLVRRLCSLLLPASGSLSTTGYHVTCFHKSATTPTPRGKAGAAVYQQSSSGFGGGVVVVRASTSTSMSGKGSFFSSSLSCGVVALAGTNMRRGEDCCGGRIDPLLFLLLSLMVDVVVSLNKQRASQLTVNRRMARLDQSINQSESFFFFRGRQAKLDYDHLFVFGLGFKRRGNTTTGILLSTKVK